MKVTDAAVAGKCSPKTILRLIQLGAIKAEKVPSNRGAGFWYKVTSTSEQIEDAVKKNSPGSGFKKSKAASSSAAPSTGRRDLWTADDISKAAKVSTSAVYNQIKTMNLQRFQAGRFAFITDVDAQKIIAHFRPKEETKETVGVSLFRFEASLVLIDKLITRLNTLEALTHRIANDLGVSIRG